MANVWMIDNTSNDWAVAPLDGAARHIVGIGLSAAPPRATEGAASLRRVDGPDGAVWALVAPSGVRVNASPSWLGIRVLQDRDEILLPGGERFFFSTEELAVVEEFRGAERPVYCPRCKQELHPGPVVRCPTCSALHHSSDELPCWQYEAKCTLCDQPTDLGGSYRWSPASL